MIFQTRSRTEYAGSIYVADYGYCTNSFKQDDDDGSMKCYAKKRKIKTMEKMYLVIPAYNEEENIKTVIEEWNAELKKYEDLDYRIIVVNDGSKDSTLEVLKSCKNDIHNLEIVDKKNGGHGSAVLYGYRYAIKNGVDWIFQTDGDGQTVPDEFGGLWKLRNHYAAIIGRRPERGDGKSRKIVEDVLCFLMHLIFGVRLQDVNAPFRLMKTELVEQYIRLLPEEYNLPNAMLTTLFAYYRENIVFKDITFNRRKNGTNSINLKSITRIGFRAVFGFLSIRRKL